MRTPPLRSRVRASGAAVVLLVLLAVDVGVYLSVQHRMDEGLAEVLEARADIAEGLVSVVPDAEALAAELTERGIPAVVTDPTGVAYVAEPSVPRFSQGGVPTTTPFPRASLQRDLDGGISVTIFATLAGMRTTLRRLLLSLALATTLGFALSLALLDRATRTALAPLEEVAATAERTQAGRITERLAPDRPDTELGRLALAFDEMLDRLQEALTESADEQERTRRFLADAAHQLRTPIAGIQASVEALLRQDDPEERDRLMGSIVRETGRSARLVRALLRMAYLDQGRRPELAPVDLAELARSEAARAADLAPRLHLHVEGASSPIVVPADESQVREAVGNLLDNARRHARSRIEVAVRRTADTAELCVADDGDGVDPAATAIIFERFATLDGKGGSGLGLPIARGIARAHGGDVTYAEGTFVLTLPATSAATDADVPLTSSASTPRTAATSPSATT